MLHKIGGRANTGVIISPKIVNGAICGTPGAYIHIIAEYKTPVVFRFIGSACPRPSAVVMLRIIITVYITLRGLIPYIRINVCQKVINRVFVCKYLVNSYPVLRNLVKVSFFARPGADD